MKRVSKKATVDVATRMSAELRKRSADPKTEYKDSEPHKVTDPNAIGPEALQLMKDKGGTWAAYQNVALDSANLGHFQYLKYGEDCTYKAPPNQYPKDTEAGMGWRYLYAGEVDLEKGVVVPKKS